MSMLCAGRERCLPTFYVSRVSFPCIVVELVYDGLGKLRVGDVTYDLYPGVIFCYGLDLAHDIWADPKQPMCKYFAAYQWTGKSERPPEGMISPGELRCTLELSAMQMLFDELIREGRRAGKLHEELTTRFLEIILLKANEGAQVETDVRDGAMQSYERVATYISTHFERLSGLADLSKRVELDRTYICRLFQRFAQETPNQSITRHKLNRAAELLLSKSLSVRQVSEQVGYEDAFYFSRLFKKRFGFSPKHFRDSTKT